MRASFGLTNAEQSSRETAVRTMVGFNRALVPSEEVTVATVQAEVVRRARQFTAAEETDAVAYGEAIQMLVRTLMRTYPPEPAHVAEGVTSARGFARALQ